ncbi:MAG: hypothetical protein AABY22_33345 [Nanoarchaeota archaeon]
MKGIVSLTQVRDLVSSIGWGPALVSFFGKLNKEPDILSFKARREGVVLQDGWLVTWVYDKPDAHRESSSFCYSITVLIQERQTRTRVLESIFDAFRRFVEHELREGFLVGQERAFDPHRGEEISS